MKVKEVLGSEKVLEAISIIYPFKISSDADVEETLRGLSIFGHRTVDALLEIGTEDELYQLISDTADIILETYEKLDESRKSTISWGENKLQMTAVLKSKYKNLFERVEEEVERSAKFNELKNQIHLKERRLRGNISALISSKEVAEDKKREIRNSFENIRLEIKKCNLLNMEQKQELLGLVNSKIGLLYKLTDLKLKEKPIHLLYYKTGSRVSVKVNLNKNGYTYTKGRGNEVRYNRGKDKEEFPIIVSVSYISDFLFDNGVRDEDVYVDPRSIDRFYYFENKISHNLTPSFIEEWYDYDCPTLYRVEPNKNRHTNMLGMPLCHFSTSIIESTWNSVYVDDSILKDEAEKIINVYPNTRVAEELRNVLRAKELKNSGELLRIEEFVREYDAKVQEVIDKHEEEILKKLYTHFSNFSTLKTGTDGSIDLYINENHFGLDCGFIYIQPRDSRYKEYRSILRNAKDNYVSQWMDITLPYNCQSVTIKEVEFKIIKEIVKKELGIELIAHTVLD